MEPHHNSFDAGETLTEMVPLAEPIENDNFVVQDDGVDVSHDTEDGPSTPLSSKLFDDLVSFSKSPAQSP
jgi:hypothetical protein